MNENIAARSRFLEEYRQVRHAEGRGSSDPAYYCALPYEDLSGRNSAMWAMRARTYRYFEQNILAPIERGVHSPLDILDLGAGNCWMSYRLSRRGHKPLSLDIFHDERDGLLAAKYYPLPLPAVEAEFNHLPFPPGRFDLAIYNASLHYSTDYFETLSEVRRCLKRSGRVVILDSPIYRSHADGELMVKERKSAFLSRYGFQSDAMNSIEFLDEPELRRLSEKLHLKWSIYRPWYGWSWHLRPWKARLQKRRPPSRFWILVGRFSE
jgi:SAM-dependent methyltransferase